MKRLIGLALVLTLAACGEKPGADPAATGVAADEAASVAVEGLTPQPPEVDAFAGRWAGPEGLFLQIDPQGEGEYRLTLKDSLDDQAEYTAEVTPTGLSFQRKGRTVIIHKGTGAETGFKWLAEKKDCLILVDGEEGYCRD